MRYVNAVAPELLGKLLVYKMPEGIASGMIIEVASCAGSNDKGRTPMETGNSAGLLVSRRNNMDIINVKMKCSKIDLFAKAGATIVVRDCCSGFKFSLRF